MASVTSTSEDYVGPPAYDRNGRSAPIEHNFSLSKGGQQWLNLSIYGGAHVRDQTPTFFQGQQISGMVKLDLKKDVILRSVSVSLSGELTTKMGVDRFVLLSKQLYDHENATLVPPTLSWSFDFDLPKGVKIVMSDGQPRGFKLPPTLSLKTGKTRIQYQIGVHVIRGAFGSEYKLYAPFNYIPISRPTSPPRPRTILSQGQVPAGWKTFTSSPMKGTLGDKRVAHLDCMLSLPEPFQYTRGLATPVILSITSSDANVLDIIPASSTPVVRLDRHTSLDGMISLTALSTFNNWESAPEEVCRATWLEPTVEENPNGQVQITFQGELRIPGDLQPNCSILNFQMEYAVSLYPTKFSGFTPSSSVAKAMLSERVEIATAPAYSQASSAGEPPEYS